MQRVAERPVRRASAGYQRLNCWLPRDLLRRFRLYAVRRGTTMTAIVEALIRQETSRSGAQTDSAKGA
jgi:hypothetical protein